MIIDFMSINYLAVLTAGIVYMAIGAFWHSPLGFGKMWMSLSGINEQKMDEINNSGMTLSYSLTFLGSIILAFVFAIILKVSAVSKVTDAIFMGFLLWLGFIAKVTLNPVLWEKKPWGLYILTNSYQLLSLLLVSLILFYWV